MKISDIRLGVSGIIIEAKIVEVGEPRTVNTKYGPRNVADAILEDGTGQIKLSLWEDQIDSVSVGDKVAVRGAYVTQFRDTLQLNIPKTGKLEVVK
ncbi:MAG: DNA-binding protein [Candidatus Aenigmarchaeota archaeon]|nr:DNA-binding protein [Candidatus Aenigmarchaeota archaeon]